MDTLDELRNLGYFIDIAGKNIRYVWRGSGNPPVEKALPLLRKVKQRKQELFALLQRDRLPRKVVLQVKAIEADALAKGWTRGELWNPRFIGGKDRLHESGLAFVMGSDETIRSVTEAFIELVNRRGAVMKFYRFKSLGNG